MIEDFKVFFTNETFKALFSGFFFFDLFKLSLSLLFRKNNLFTFCYELGCLVSRELYKLSSGGRRLSDESFNDHVNSHKTWIIGFDYVF